jgi:hypothetical protein
MTQEWIRAKIAAKRRKPRKSRSYYEKMRNGLYWVEWLAVLAVSRDPVSPQFPC